MNFFVSLLSKAPLKESSSCEKICCVTVVRDGEEELRPMIIKVSWAQIRRRVNGQCRCNCRSHFACIHNPSKVFNLRRKEVNTSHFFDLQLPSHNASSF